MDTPQLVTSCYTDNGSHLINSTHDFIDDPSLPSFTVHTGCTVYQIQIFAYALIRYVTEIFKDLEENKEGCKDHVRTLGENRVVNILDKLIELTGTLHKNLFYLTIFVKQSIICTMLLKYKMELKVLSFKPFST